MVRRYYVAGPMRGHPEFNFPAFIEKTEELRTQNHYVFNPAERDIERGFDYRGLTGSTEELQNLGFNLREALATDTEFICLEATHIYMLPGWSSSKGATAERALALALGLTVEGAPS